jgi:hypothetical protein
VGQELVDFLSPSLGRSAVLDRPLSGWLVGSERHHPGSRPIRTPTPQNKHSSTHSMESLRENDRFGLGWGGRMS